ncbi:MAG TPA: RHS repeat-associated core domain-containing protein [Gammaproteobacteria bacterium]|nr:RHS repeat-associated core domain-containing protein [Gammaproteobacteria bacterium]
MAPFSQISEPPQNPGRFNNAFGLRTEKRTQAGTMLYHYDPRGRLLSETDAEGQVRRDYVWRNRVPVAQIDRAGYGRGTKWDDQGHDRGEDGRSRGPDRVFYLHTDGIGTVRLATDARGAVVWRWGGGAFGSSPPTGGKLPDRPRDAEDMDHAVARPTVTINLRFPGQYYDRETGFFYNWARYYNPETGRYISSDPIGLLGGDNTYAYVGGNPLRSGDPMGLLNLCFPGYCSNNDIFPSIPGTAKFSGGLSPPKVNLELIYPQLPPHNPLSASQPSTACFLNCPDNFGLPPLSPAFPPAQPPLGPPAPAPTPPALQGSGSSSPSCN